MAELTAQDYVEKAKELSLWQFQDKEVIQGLFQSWVEQIQDKEDTAMLLHLINIYNAVGKQLDELYGELFNVPRRGRTDEQYRSAILAKISTTGSDGTTERLFSDLRTITGSNEYVKIFEHFPADVHVWLGDGYSSYSYPEVEDLVQAGVNIRLIVDDEHDSFVMTEVFQTEGDLQVNRIGALHDLQVSVVSEENQTFGLFSETYSPIVQVDPSTGPFPELGYGSYYGGGDTVDTFENTSDSYEGSTAWLFENTHVAGWSGVAIASQESFGYLDLSSYDDLVFYIKGDTSNIQLELYFHVDDANPWWDGANPDFRASVSFTDLGITVSPTEWTEVRVPKSEFVPLGANPVDWSRIITPFSMNVLESASLTIDNIYYENTAPSTFGIFSETVPQGAQLGISGDPQPGDVLYPYTFTGLADTVDTFEDTSDSYEGSNAWLFENTHVDGWSGFAVRVYESEGPLDLTSYDTLVFHVKGDSTDFTVNVWHTDYDGLADRILNVSMSDLGITISPTEWTEVRIPTNLLVPPTDTFPADWTQITAPFSVTASSSDISVTFDNIYYENTGRPPAPLEWSQLTRGLNTGLETANLAAVACDGTNWVVSGEQGRAARSTDRGETWSPLTQGLNSGSVSLPYFKALAASVSGVFIATGSLGYSAISTDGGATWSAATRGLGNGITASFNDIATDNTGNWIAVGSSSVVGYSTDNGVTWNAGGSISGFGGENYFGVTYIGIPGHFIVVGGNGLAAITTDSGATFEPYLTPQGLNSGNVNANFQKAVYAGGEILYVQGRGEETAYSTDGGTTWVAGPLVSNSGNIGVQAFGDLAWDGYDSLVSVQEDGYAAVSSNRGADWASLPQGLSTGLTGADFNAVASDGNGTWVAVANSGFASRSVAPIAFSTDYDLQVSIGNVSEESPAAILPEIGDQVGGENYTPLAELLYNFSPVPEELLANGFGLFSETFIPTLDLTHTDDSPTEIEYSAYFGGLDAFATLTETADSYEGNIAWLFDGDPDAGGWSGFYIKTVPAYGFVDLSEYDTLVFHVKGTSSDFFIEVIHSVLTGTDAAYKGQVSMADIGVTVHPTNWTEVRIPLSEFVPGAAGAIDWSQIHVIFTMGLLNTPATLTFDNIYYTQS